MKIYLIIGLIFSSCTTYNLSKRGGVIRTEETAVNVAEDIWLGIYGESINDFKPFIVQFENGIWKITGKVPEGFIGGGPYIEIKKNNGKILKVTHYK